MLSVTNANDVAITSASHIGNLNPLRYRGDYYDSETGFYYVSSRYYDPEIGRWINADSAIGQVGDIQGTNMFAYCFNNPVNMDDQSGNWPEWIKSAAKWVAKEIVKPVVETVQETLSEVDLTYSTGFNLSGTPSFWIFNGQIGVSMDTKGNVAIQYSLGGGAVIGNPGISVTHYNSITTVPDIKRLEGKYYQIGASAAVPIEGIPFAGAGDIMLIPDERLNTTYYGITQNMGVGSPGVESHVEWGTTGTVPHTEFNIFDVARSMYNNIMRW